MPIGGAHFGSDITFSDVFTFDLSSSGKVLGTALTFNAVVNDSLLTGLQFSSIQLFDYANTLLASDTAPAVDANASDLLTLGTYAYSLFANLPAKSAPGGYYRFVVNGTTGSGSGGGYLGGVGVPIPVPEASNTALLLSGLGLVGMIALRRRPGR